MSTSQPPELCSGIKNEKNTLEREGGWDVFCGPVSTYNSHFRTTREDTPAEPQGLALFRRRTPVPNPSCLSKLHYSSCYLATTFSPNQDHHAYTPPAKAKLSGFTGGSVKKNPPAEDTGSIPDPGRSHMLQSN
ncbi:unnamed protein product [Rangifer tarandus platyrhynchus]|uniref:Uncharacterized protein n=2 Tax=Rangifer tarandus platyrhynchus TaxID=3082113 RepID=A0AC59YXY6_RANTA|nr:unnamed protein product [Rangifer tarandus platyrhynchus]